MQPHGILESVLYAHDLLAAECFYRDVLRLPLHSSDPNRHLFFHCGEGLLLIFNPTATTHHTIKIGEGIIPSHGAVGAGHLAFRVLESELAAWRNHLQQQQVTIESEISWPQGGHSIYFRDPAGNSLELVTPAVWGLPETT